MIFEYYYFDLDDTLYDFSNLHNKIINNLINKYNIDYNDIKYIINNSSNVSFKHNKLYYFNYKLSPFLLKKIYDEYYNYIYSNITLFEGILELFDFIKNINKKIAIITNNSLDIQLEKLNRLGILGYIDCLITSEEVQYEKPHHNIYEVALGRTKMTPVQVCMIGDNINHDIFGALDIGIFSFYFTNKVENILKIKEKYIEFNNYNTLLNLFNNIYNNINDFKRLSIKYGQCIELTQSNGGNISIKCDNLMIIKPSGCELGNISNNTISIIDNELLKYNLINKIDNIPVLYGKKASIETFFHSILQKYTVHIHPSSINGILCDKNANNIINNLNINYDYIIIDYIKPGIELSYEIYKNYKNNNIIFMLNHGIIITTNNITDIDLYLYHILEKFNLYSTIYSIRINNIYINQSICVYQTYNTIILNNINNELINICPDYTLYLQKPIIYDSINDINYDIIRNMTIPYIIKIENDVYIIGHNLNHCKKIEDIYCGYLITLSKIKIPKLLNNNEINDIINWDSEKYRKNKY